MTSATLSTAGLPSRRTRVVLIITTMVGALHHVDHVLRADHSGFPFTPDVNPFTVSLVAYPIVAFACFAHGWHWLKVWLLFAAYVATQVAHILVETPLDQYTVWATNASRVPEVLGQPNLLNIASPTLGVLATVISLLLSFFLVASTLSLFLDAQRATAKG